jgi:hypothetical protein
MRTKKKKKIINMKKFERLSENDISKIVKTLLKEDLSTLPFETISNNFPDNLDGTDFFSKVIPKIYEKSPDRFVNACASRLSLALNNAGYTPSPVAFKTQNDYSVDGKNYPKGSSLITSAIVMKDYLTKNFGKPLIVPNDDSQKVAEAINGVKGMFVITKVPGWGASGHADIYRGGDGSDCGNNCHFGEGGTLYFWGMKSQLQVNAFKCGWNNDVEGYKKSNWTCYDDPLKSSPAKNAKKCGYGDDVKAYRLSGYKCKINRR